MKSRWALKDTAHKNEKIVRLLLGCFFAVILSYGYTTSVFADDSQVEVLVGDVCPNIPGLQPTVPTGMTQDADKSCLTPSPLPPPDACTNIDGYQTAIPSGYYQKQPGICVTQTKPPKDVCPNIDGVQSSVPTGMSTGANGDCLPPIIDVCPNIPGPQQTLPDGMKQDGSHTCFTPSPVEENDNPGGKPTPGITAKPSNFMAFLESIPEFVARTIPYYIIGGLLVTTLFVAWQNFTEAIAAAHLIVFFKLKKQLAEQKDTFISLSLHYLQHTFETMLTSISKMTAPDKVLEPAKQSISSLQTELDKAASEALQGTVLENVAKPQLIEHRATMYKTATFWVPVMVTISLIVLVNVLLGVVARKDLGVANLAAQCILLVAVSGLFYEVLRSRRLHHIDRENDEELIRHEYEIDTARNEFSKAVATTLGNSLGTTAERHASLASLPPDDSFDGSFAATDRTVSRLELLSQLPLVPDDSSHEKFNLQTLVSDCVSKYQEMIAVKQVTVTNTVQTHWLTHHKSRVTAVIDNLLESTLALSESGSTVTISLDTPIHATVLQISDQQFAPQAFNILAKLEADEEPDADELALTVLIASITAQSAGASIEASPTTNNVASIALKLPR